MQFFIEDLSCQHCAGVITRTVAGVDPVARLHIDIPAKTVQIHTAASPSVMAAALNAAGYPAVLQQD